MFAQSIIPSSQALRLRGIARLQTRPEKTDAAVSPAITGGSTLNGTRFSGNRSYCMGQTVMPKHYKTEPMNITKA
jgi:hypothetical protein